PLPVSGVGGVPSTYPGFAPQLPVTFTTAGDHSLTAKYSGDSNYAAPSTQPQIIQPLYVTTTNVSINTPNIKYGDTIKVTALVNTGQKSPTISGQISLTSNYGTIPAVTATQSTDASGNTVLTATFTDTPQQQSEWYFAT